VTIPATTLIFVVGVLVYFSDRLTPFIVIKYFYSMTRTPEMYLVPVTRVAQRSAENYNHYDLSTKSIKFKAPWKLREKVELDYGTLFAFVNKKGIEIVKKDEDERILRVTEIFNSTNDQHFNSMGYLQPIFRYQTFFQSFFLFGSLLC